MTFTYRLGTFAYKVVPVGLCNAATIFQRVVLSIFAHFVHEIMEMYMDEFTLYGNKFQGA